MNAHPAKWWHRLDDGRVQCDLCPRDCKLHEGQRGACFVRQMLDDEMILTTWGRSSGFCVDPIEKKPLNHFFPGSRVLSFGTAGCNLSCRFCQNWDISRSRQMDTLAAAATPEMIALEAVRLGCQSVAFTYNDPVIFAEYAMDVADACHGVDVKTVAVTAGYIHPEARAAFFGKMDAANVDLKAFTDEFYFHESAAHLQPVLDTLRYLARETAVWTEVTTLLIPGRNDASDELQAMCQWLLENMGADVPLHFSAFHPDYRMLDVPATPFETLQRARDIARGVGLRYVYTGNVRDLVGAATVCPQCAQVVVERNGYDVLRYELTGDGHCTHCGAAIAGRFGPYRGAFGNHRIPSALGRTR